MKPYGLCPRKFKAREITLVQAWRDITGKFSLPSDQQLWTLCGPLVGPDGGVMQKSELGHVLDSGLLSSAGQFHGVERDPEIHKANIRATSKMRPRPKFHYGDIVDVLGEASVSGSFRPALVNLDTQCMPDRGVSMLGSVLYILNRTPGAVLVVLNVALKYRQYRESSWEELNAGIVSDTFCRSQLSKGWFDFPSGYEYNGTGQSGTKMGTLQFFRPA